MRGIDLQAMLSNLTQLDKHQQDGHRTPMVNQEANAERAREEASKRINMPVEPDAVEGKNVDPDGKREEQPELKGKRSKKKKKGKKGRSAGDTGMFVDVDA